MKIGFIAATKRHLNYKNEVAVRDYYSVSPLFRYGLAYCEKNYDQTFVLSFGSPVFLTPDDGVKNVDENIDQLSKADKKKWVREIASQIDRSFEFHTDLYFHLPNSYNTLVRWVEYFYGTAFKNYQPVASMPIGRQLEFYKSRVGQLPSIKNEEAK